ncbi:uncharacterized protein BBOV_IV005630 [Babesia bovis T2Bo]|uniref:Membrane protein, putative n=1 Tax=Babesia bovis TaxID=5865 RepID=A7AQV5_BABBO|nr:uncharacterized protein BBOV_IV005630 [Babesia bovis T2Bo]EDO06924.1 putative integral membrane protein [Babesia bovis T2Bo]|eukprot:XP_001610492.1 hypothetical protein [Babesia bovis T2Bo]
MDNTTCTTIVLVLLWLSICCQAVGLLVTLISYYSNPELLQHYSSLYGTYAVIPSTTTLSTLLLVVCLWQCKKAGYLVTPMTWYHWVLLVLLVLLQIVAVLTEYLGLQGWGHKSLGTNWKYPIYSILVVLMVILGSTLYCGWKCNLFCRPCCKSQYVCYGSAIVVVLAVLIVLAVIASMGEHRRTESFGVGFEWLNEILTIGYFGYMVVPITQCYTMAVLWRTTMKLPYTVPEVVTLLTSVLTVASILALALASILAVTVSGSTHKDGVQASTKAYYSTLLNTAGYPLLAAHLLCLGITWYCMEYKGIFYWPKNYLCFGVLAAVLVVALVLVLVVIVIPNVEREEGGDVDAVKYTLIGYSILLMIPTLWYGYRCGLFKWCLPKKKGLEATDIAENTTADTDIAKEE